VQEGKIMKNFINQIEKSLDSRLYYLSLISTLTIPDIAGAMDSKDGRASRDKYIEWFEKYVRPRYIDNMQDRIPDTLPITLPNIESPLTGEACYKFRCSMLHQGSTQHPKSPYSRIIFIEPGATTNIIHYSQLKDALCIDLELFCKEVMAGCRIWLNDVEDTDLFRKNFNGFARRHPEGLSPYIKGAPVIG
jgi:hypothetical protein